MMERTRYSDVEPYITKDGSLIRELMHPQRHGNANQSLAEALVVPGMSTALHRHHRSEELYHVIGGEGRMTLGDETFEVQVGDTIFIPPGMPHCLTNTGTRDLRVLCFCTPPYSHSDTEVLTAQA